MTYIENIFLCLAIPMILSLFFIKGRSRSYTLFLSNADRIADVILVGWLIRLSFSIMAFFVMQMVSERSRQERRLGALLIFHTLDMGYFLRLARLVGHTVEIFFYSSYKDKWNPVKTSEVAFEEGL